MLLIADAVLPMQGGEVFSPGAVCVEGGRIQAVGLVSDFSKKPGEEVLEMTGCVVTPGLINAHTHLDYTDFLGKLDRGGNFAEWIEQIVALKRTFAPEDYRKAIEKGARLLIETGTTSAVNIAAVPDVLDSISTPEARIWWCWELIDAGGALDVQALWKKAQTFWQGRKGWKGGIGLSPHAPYSASTALYRAVKSCVLRDPGCLVTTHLGESREEEMFAQQEGPLHALLQKWGRSPYTDGNGKSALAHLLKEEALAPGTLAAHVNHGEEQAPALAKLGISVVHCPRSHAYFGHRRFALETFLEAGVNVCLGTDSLASNQSLDLRGEIQEAQKRYPSISAIQWLEMATIHGARALKQEGKLGVLAPGAWADLVAWPCDGKSDPAEAVIQGSEPPRLVMVQGKKVSLS